LSIKKNFRNKNNINEIKKNIESKRIKVDYFELRNKKNLSKKIDKNNFKIFIAYYINNIRLIDNF
jgi:pantoate--beta-alanine ligase